MAKCVSIADLERGEVGRVRLSEFARLCRLSNKTAYGKVKAGIVGACRDENGAIFIDASEVLRYLRGEKYIPGSTDSSKLERIGRARSAKKR